MNSGETKLAGVMGWPVAHSKSPRLHGFWLQRLNVDGAYLPLPVAPENLADAIVGLSLAYYWRFSSNCMTAAAVSSIDRRVTLIMGQPCSLNRRRAAATSSRTVSG